jgi:hypothetical protein
MLMSTTNSLNIYLPISAHLGAHLGAALGDGYLAVVHILTNMHAR